MLSIPRSFLLSIFALASLAACKPQENNAAQATASAASAAENSPKPQTRGTDMRQEDIGGDFTLTDGDGKPFSLSDSVFRLYTLPGCLPNRAADIQRHAKTTWRSG